MDKIANRPRGFAFLRYETEEESQKAIEGMHGKVSTGYYLMLFLDFYVKRCQRICLLRYPLVLHKFTCDPGMLSGLVQWVYKKWWGAWIMISMC